MPSLYKTLVRPHVEYCSYAWNPYYSKNKKIVGKDIVQAYEIDNEYVRQGA